MSPCLSFADYAVTSEAFEATITKAIAPPWDVDLKAKLLVMHGMADDNVLFLHSTKLFRKHQDLGKPFDVMVYPGAKHGLIRQHDGRHAYATIKRFLDENLRP
jgi:dipeptidyl-peptidase 4